MRKLKPTLLYAFVLFGPVPAFAYIPPSDFLVRMVVKKHEGLKNIRIRSQVTNSDNSAHFVETTVYDAALGSLQSVAKDESGQELFRMERKELADSIVSAVLFATKLPKLEVDLKQKGVPIVTEREIDAIKDEPQRQNAESEFLGRFKSTLAWVVGRNDKTTAQLWIEKDTFLPIKFIFSPKVSNGGEIDLENYRFTREFPYPKLMTYLKPNSQTGFKVETLETSVNTKDLDIGGMGIYGMTDAGNSASSSLKELLQNYYELIR